MCAAQPAKKHKHSVVRKSVTKNRYPGRSPSGYLFSVGNCLYRLRATAKLSIFLPLPPLALSQISRFCFFRLLFGTPSPTHCDVIYGSPLRYIACGLAVTLTSTDQKTPTQTPAMTTRSQKSLDSKRLWPRSKMYWMPCSELASPYSFAV